MLCCVPRLLAGRAWMGSVVAATCLVGSPAAGAAISAEQAVLEALNSARTNPAAYAQALRQYRTFYHAKLVVVPGDRVRRVTDEGASAVTEAAALLVMRPPAPVLSWSDMLASAAATLVGEQSRSGATGHLTAGDVGPADRVRSRGGGGRVAEAISYGAIDPADVVRQLIIDDGVPTRGHRRVLFDLSYRFAGVACGPHPAFRTMCVIDLSETANGESNAHQFIVALREAPLVERSEVVLKTLGRKIKRLAKRG